MIDGLEFALAAGSGGQTVTQRLPGLLEVGSGLVAGSAALRSK
jgi:hypothetical protein